MRYKNPLDGLFASQTSTRVLRVLARSPEKSFTSRELAAAARAPPHRVLEVMNRFQQEGVVRSRAVGRAFLWTTNRENPLVPALQALFEAESRAGVLYDGLLEEHLGGLRGVVRVLVFGSAARGRERSASDLDLLIITRDAASKRAVEARLGSMQEAAHGKLGSRVRPIVYTMREYRQRSSLPLVQAIEREGQELRPKGSRK